jgi:excinuclease ABC subunit B
VTVPVVAEEEEEYRSAEDVAKAVATLRKQMRAAAQELEFERAAELRDRLQHLEARELELRNGVRAS